MISTDASEIAAQLADRAEAVCRRYLPAGRKEGAYWLVGDIQGRPGRSLYVRLRGPLTGKGAAGRWTDAATAEHGDLLDVIRLSAGMTDFKSALSEARRFLSLPDLEPRPTSIRTPEAGPGAARASAQRLVAAASPIRATLGETYLRTREIVLDADCGALRFHPRCYYGASDDTYPQTWPAVIAAVTDLEGTVTGVHRTWLARDGAGKAPVATPRRSKGDLLGNGVRFGVVDDVLAVGEGLETILSIRRAAPRLPLLAALSAPHLAAIAFPPGLRTLYVVRDNDPAGDYATDALFTRAHAASVTAVLVAPRLGDLNDDLMQLGVDMLRDTVAAQLLRHDVGRFMD